MARRKLLLTGLAALFLAAFIAPLPAAATAPSSGGGWADRLDGSKDGTRETDFSATNQGDRVDLRGATSGGSASSASERGGESGSSSGSSAGGTGASADAGNGGNSTAPPRPPRPTCVTSDNLSPTNGVGFCPAPPPAPSTDATGPAPEQVQLGAEDVASLAPSNGVLQTEPGGWALAGLPFNPSAQSEPQNVTGELLGLPVEVRFTPVAFHWDYGDGSNRTSTTGGGTWQQLGQSEFTETATSRTYAQRGVYQLTLRLEQTADYRVLPDGGWQAVPGTVLTEVASESIEVGAAGTVLVDRSCDRGARGPGC